ncbi:MAG: hypothetical protein HKO76_00170 [Acidimicrobiia bacterium]|nr:hypothetical protein [Acidimicrobiia bacterium]
MKRWLFIMIAVLLAGCAPGTETYVDQTAGFFSGVWHGWIAPFTLIWQIFDENIRIYEANNTGWWYDLGFYMAVISGFGGLALRRKTKPTRTKK